MSWFWLAPMAFALLGGGFGWLMGLPKTKLPGRWWTPYAAAIGMLLLLSAVFVGVSFLLTHLPLL